MHLAVYPPHGRIRLAVPKKNRWRCTPNIVNWNWIKKTCQKTSKNRPEKPSETTYLVKVCFFRNSLLLEVEEHSSYSSVKKIEEKLKNKAKSKTRCNNWDKSLVVREWYKQLKNQLEPLVEKEWEKVIGVTTNDWDYAKHAWKLNGELVIPIQNFG
jgi:hypothetical protein